MAKTHILRYMVVEEYEYDPEVLQQVAEDFGIESSEEGLDAKVSALFTLHAGSQYGEELFTALTQESGIDVLTREIVG